MLILSLAFIHEHILSSTAPLGHLVNFCWDFSLHQAVLIVHDTVAQKNFEPVLPPLPDDLDDELEEESVKIVRLVKNKEPLVSFRIELFCQQNGLF